MLPSILLPRGLVLGPTYILPAHPVGNAYWVGEALGSTVADGFPTGDGPPAFEANERDSWVP